MTFHRCHDRRETLRLLAVFRETGDAPADTVRIPTLADLVGGILEEPDLHPELMALRGPFIRAIAVRMAEKLTILHDEADFSLPDYSTRRKNLISDVWCGARALEIIYRATSPGGAAYGAAERAARIRSTRDA